MNIETNDAYCDRLDQQVRSALLFSNIWQWFIIIIGAAFVFVLVNLILNATDQTLLESVQDGLTLIVEGASLGFLRKQRNLSQKTADVKLAKLKDANCNDERDIDTMAQTFGRFF